MRWASWKSSWIVSTAWRSGHLDWEQETPSRTAVLRGLLSGRSAGVPEPVSPRGCGTSSRTRGQTGPSGGTAPGATRVCRRPNTPAVCDLARPSGETVVVPAGDSLTDASTGPAGDRPASLGRWGAVQDRSRLCPRGVHSGGRSSPSRGHSGVAFRGEPGLVAVGAYRHTPSFQGPDPGNYTETPTRKG